MSRTVDHASASAVLVAARGHIRIAHHIPGRIRLKFDALPLFAALNGRFDTLRATFENLRGIAGFDVNQAAGSVVITYEPSVLAPSRWDRLLTADARSAIDELADLLKSADR